MKINKEYLKEFCEYHGIFSNTDFTDKVEKIKYNLGVTIENTNDLKDINSLEKAINKNLGKTTEVEKDLALEVADTYKNFLIQNSKVNPNPNFIGRYFSGMFGF